MSGNVVVNRCMSLDGFIAGPGDSMDWGGGRALVDFVAPDDFAEVAAATGAMLVGRRTWEVGDRMEAEEPGSTDYPFSGPMFLATARKRLRAADPTGRRSSPWRPARQQRGHDEEPAHPVRSSP
jgi:dihydrofolate reductase